MNIDNFQSRVSHGISNRDSVLVTATYQRTNTEAVNVFGFSIPKRHRISTRPSTGRTGSTSSSRCGLDTSSFVKPSNRLLLFQPRKISAKPESAQQSGTGELGPAQPDLIEASPGCNRAVPRKNGPDPRLFVEALWRRAAATLHVRRRRAAADRDVLGQQNPRGTFGFDGSISGSDFADFLWACRIRRRCVRQRGQTSARHFDERVPDR